MTNRISYSFLTIGKTKESTEGGDFKRYIGVGSSFVLAVNPDKQKQSELLGYESALEPEYTGSDDKGAFARIAFIVKTDPAVCNGIEIANRITFTLHNAPAYNKDKTKVQVIDEYGNSVWALVEDAKAGKKLFNANGNPAKIADKYRMACSGEADLTAFLKAYLNVEDAFSYQNGSWILKPNAADCVFGLEHIKDFFKGDFSEIKEALALQPNNKVKLLYGIRTTDKGQFQTIATKGEFILRNSTGSRGITRLAQQLLNAKQAGAYADTAFEVCELKEYSVEPTNFSLAPETAVPEEAGNAVTDDDMPWQ